MRTKTMFLAAAALAAGIATSVAQSNVYSLNVVGYINLDLTNGFNLVANQLDVDGTGTNNTLYTSLGTNLPNLTRVYTFDPIGATYNFATLIAGNWSAANIAAVNKGLQPGQGAFVSIPGSASYPQTVTFVGNVMQGSLNTAIGSYYQIVSSQVPQSGGIQTDLTYAPANLDRVYQWLGQAGQQGYGLAHTYVAGTWGNGEPQVGVGEAVFLQGHGGSAWARSFTVQ
jgi:hypothetical protein